jgi:hypothetical protein
MPEFRWQDQSEFREIISVSIIASHSQDEYIAYSERIVLGEHMMHNKCIIQSEYIVSDVQILLRKIISIGEYISEGFCSSSGPFRSILYKKTENKPIK